MKKTKNILITILIVVLILILITLGIKFIFRGAPVLTFADGNNTENELSTNNSENSALVADSESESQIIIAEPLSYVEACELDYVATPEKRTREEAVAKLKELSRWYPGLYYVYENEEQYPLELLLSGAGNPEMTDYLYGYLTSDGSVTGGFTDEEQPEDYPLLLQFDTRWGYMPYGSGGTVGSSGCGPTCLSMAVFYLTGNRECTPDTVAQYSLDDGYYVEGVGTAWTLLDNYPTEYGLTSTRISWSEAKLKAELDKGNILICSVRPGDFTSTGHFILIYGYDENGFKINDPKCVYRSRLTWTYDQIQDDIKAAWSVGK